MDVLMGYLLVVGGCGVVFLLCMVRSGLAAEVTHPVYPVAASPERIEELEQAVAEVMALSEEQMVALVPDRTGFQFLGCPNCDEGTQDGQLTWSIADPHHVVCRYCDMVYPGGDYPEDQVLRVTNPVGEEVEYPYWEDETGYRYFFSARGWRAARNDFAARADDLGELYQMTGEVQYARRAALILDAFARYYPGFLVSYEHGVRQPKEFVFEPPYPNMGGKWGRWRHDEMPADLVLAYDRIYDSGELERLSEETGADVKARVENDFFRGAIRQDGFQGRIYSNASPRIYQGYAVIGRVLGDPELVHEAVRRSRGLFEQQFYEDGFWSEGSVGYHQMTMRGMRAVFDALRGHTDPAGYVDPEDGTRLDDLDLERDIPVIARALRIPEICRYPDGRTLPVHDNWARNRDGGEPGRSTSTLLCGVGHAWLGRGSAEDQIQAHLHFSGGYGHEHADNLNIALFAKGNELLSDLGYTHTRYRPWSTSTLCHNTVVIDEQRQYTYGEHGPSDGRLLAFETAHDPVQWMEAAGEGAYPGVATVYRRMVMLVAAGDTDAYVVDLFRVDGGSQHDWALHGSADRDGTGSVDVALVPYADNLLPGVQVRYPESESDRGDAEDKNLSYAFFQNVSRGEVDDGLMSTFEVAVSQVGVRTHLPGQSSAEVFLGDAPSIRRAEENDALTDQHRMPILLLRRKGEAPLSSRYAAVHEPYSVGRFVEEVNQETHAAGEGAIALSVRHHGVTDHILHWAGGEGGDVTVGDLRLQGEMGFVRERDGLPEMMGLWGGRELRWRDHVLTGSGVYEGEVTRTLRLEAGEDRDALVLTRDLPEGDGLRGTTAVVTFGDGSTRGHRVQGVRGVEGQTHLLLEDEPGFTVQDDGARHLYFPLREIPGLVSCRIRTSAFATFDGGTPRITSVGEASLSGA